MAGLENILGVNSTVGEVFDKHWAVSAKSCPSCTLVIKKWENAETFHLTRQYFVQELSLF